VSSLKGLGFFLSRLPSVETLGYLLSRRTALVHSTAPHRFEDQSSFAPNHPLVTSSSAPLRMKRRKWLAVRLVANG